MSTAWEPLANEPVLDVHPHESDKTQQNTRLVDAAQTMLGSGARRA